MHYPSPLACKVDGLHPHLAQQMADARYFTRKQVMVFHPKEGEPAAWRRIAQHLDTRRHATDQVSTVQVPRRSVPGR
jgi:hypothetical protein